MTEQQLSLLPFYAGWGRYNQRLVAAIAPLTGEQLALRTTPLHWSIGMYATHIVANRAWWFHARMGEGSDDLTPFDLWALGVCEADVDPGHTAAELVAGLEKTWRLIEETLARLTPADLKQVVPPLTQADRERHANWSILRSSHTPGCGWMRRLFLEKQGPQCRSSQSSGVCSNMTSTTAAKSPPRSASTICQLSTWTRRGKGLSFPLS